MTSHSSNNGAKETKELMNSKRQSINNEHDKVFRAMFQNKRIAVNIIKQALGITLNTTDIELYETKYITKHYENKEADIVYKIINKDKIKGEANIKN